MEWKKSNNATKKLTLKQPCNTQLSKSKTQMGNLKTLTNSARNGMEAGKNSHFYWLVEVGFCHYLEEKRNVQ